jgi:multisubunit Na+/H+ antiporter MnhG subunit
MSYSDDKKLEIILMQLEERYNALHKMRDRSTSFTLWILGFGLGLAWMLTKEGEQLSWLESIFLILFIVLMTCVSLNFLAAIHRGFNKNRDIVIQIETSLDLYNKNNYICSPILPEEYANRRAHWANHFTTLYLLVIATSICLIVMAAACPIKATKKAPLDIKKLQQLEPQKAHPEMQGLPQSEQHEVNK